MSTLLAPPSPRNFKRRLGWFLTLSSAALLASATAWAGGSKVVRLAGSDRFEDGELRGVAVEASGKMTVGYQSKRTPLTEVSAAFRCNKTGKRTYLGTADKSRLFVLATDGDAIKPTLVSEMPGLAVSAIAEARDGSVLAAVLPGGQLYRLARDGKPQPFAKLPAERIWDLLVAADGIYAATGPDGKVFRVSADGKEVKLVFDAEERDAFSLAQVGRNLVVGTAGRARLYQITGKESGQLLQDFDGDEVRALAVQGSKLFAVINRFESRGISSLGTLTKDLERASLSGQGPKNSDLAANPIKGTGRLMRIDLGDKLDLDRAAEGEWELYFARSKLFFSDLLLTDDDTILLSTSDSGKIYRIRGLRDHAVIADLEERQALGLCRVGVDPNTGRGAIVALAGDGAAVYRLLAGPSKTPSYTSEVLDLGGISRLGAIALRGRGEMRLRARSGPSDKVDSRWSAWQEIKLEITPTEYRGSFNGPSQRNLPNHRWLQIEVSLGSSDAELKSLEFFHAPHNLAPILESVAFRGPKFETSDDKAPSGRATITWSADARDDDNLHYEVRLRADNGQQGDWIVLTKDGPIQQTEWPLDLDTLPDGVYEVAIKASDEPSNGSASALVDNYVSDPFVLDRTPPTLTTLNRNGDRIEGQAADAVSRIHDVMYKIDDAGFRPASPRDGIFDSQQEGFVLHLPNLYPGKHRVVVRARDAAGNLITRAIAVDVGVAQPAKR